MSGSETIQGHVWDIDRCSNGSYIAVCTELNVTAFGDTYEELRESIDEIIEDLKSHAQD